MNGGRLEVALVFANLPDHLLNTIKAVIQTDTSVGSQDELKH